VNSMNEGRCNYERDTGRFFFWVFWVKGVIVYFRRAYVSGGKMKCLLALNNCFERTSYFVEMESESIVLHITCDILGTVLCEHRLSESVRLVIS